VGAVPSRYFAEADDTKLGNLHQKTGAVFLAPSFSYEMQRSVQIKKLVAENTRQHETRVGDWRQLSGSEAVELLFVCHQLKSRSARCRAVASDEAEMTCTISCERNKIRFIGDKQLCGGGSMRYCGQ